MKIGLLSKNPRSYSTSRLKQACLARGHKPTIYNPAEFSLYTEEHQPKLFYRGKGLTLPNAVIPRIGAAASPFALAVLRQFEQLGVFNLNNSNAVGVARDKLRTLQLLSRRDIGIPPSAFVKQAKDILPAIEQVGGAPVILKLLQGTQGAGVMLAETSAAAGSIVETLQLAQQEVLIQKFVSESKGRDIRALVVGKRVVAAMRRHAASGEFRSNVHREASTEAVELDPFYAKTAVFAAHIVGLRVAGVDMLETSTGPQVMEVNASPGLEGIEQTTGVDVAGAIIEYLQEQVAFPDLDVRERLWLREGFGVTEVHVHNSSPLAEHTVGTAQFEQNDIQVLVITREGETIPNPPTHTKLAAGDRLLCFGKLTSMRELLSAAPRPRSRRVRASYSNVLLGLKCL